MKIHLSPWQHIETSLVLPSSKRRRKRSNSDASANTEDASIAASFVVQRRTRSSRKKRASIENTRPPVLLITSDFNISVLGKSGDGLQESTVYTSRPGKSTHFSDIPAIYDTRQDLVYALQAQNTRLVSWASSGGPDIDAVSCKLKPAVSLKLLHLPDVALLYGSCQDGSIFLARAYDSKWMVEYIPAEGLENAEHVYTFARLDQPISSGAGRKRKSANTWILTVYQILCQRTKLVLVRHSLRLPVQREQFSTEGSACTAYVDTVHSVRPKPQQLSGVRVLGRVDNGLGVVLEFGIKEDRERRFLTTVSLLNANLGGPINEVEPDICHLTLIGSDLVAGILNDGLCFYDRLHGALLHRLDVDNFDLRECFRFLADAKHRRLVALYPQDGKLVLASAVLEIDFSAMQNRLTLASGMGRTSSAVPMIRRNSNSNTIYAALDDEFLVPCLTSLDAATRLLEIAFSNVHKCSSPAMAPSYLRRVFEEVCRSLFETTGTGSNVEEMIGDNPQDAVPSRKMVDKVNGVHHSTNGNKNGLVDFTIKMNGDHGVSREQEFDESLASLPQPILDTATGYLVDIILLPEKDTYERNKLDAAVMLTKLIRTGRLSARIHLPLTLFADLLSSLQLLISVDNSKTFSLSGLVFGIVNFCSDISEAHLVHILKFILSNCPEDDLIVQLLANEDIVESFQLDKDCFDGVRIGKSAIKNELLDLPLRLKPRVILAGVADVLAKVACYSDCNEAMLREAVSNILDTRQLSVLLRLLSDQIFTVNDRFGTKRVIVPSCSVARKRMMTWAAVLCDVLRSSGPDFDEASHGHCLSQIRKLVIAEIANAESLLMLKGIITKTTTLAHASEHHVEASTFDDRKVGKLPPYQIERLAF